jgi:hypothetical protein
VTHEVHHVLRRKKPRKQLVTVVQADPVAIVPAEPVAVLADGYQPAAAVGYEGSYVAVSGTPGRGSVHVVESGRCQLQSVALSYQQLKRVSNSLLAHGRRS